MTVDKNRLRLLADNLKNEVNAVYGLYLDCIRGFQHLIVVYEDRSATNAKVTDRSQIIYGKGKRAVEGNVIEHVTTVGAYRERNSPGGRHYILLGRYIIIILFETWKVGFQEDMADAVGGDLDQPPIFDDLRMLRNDSLHKAGKLVEASGTLAELTWLNDREFINLTPDEVSVVVLTVLNGLDALVEVHTGQNPNYGAEIIFPSTDDPSAP